ncbi:MAG: sodium:solute symporter family transporter [Cytophagaceae bacterium]
MTFQLYDYFLFGLFFAFIFYLIYEGSAKRLVTSHYFNAGGKLSWFLIGASFLGTNISFEYIFNSAANGFTVGLAFGSYEWMASFIMIIVAIYILPYFLRIGVLTLPEYLQHRFNKSTRLLMAILFVGLQTGMLIPILNSNAMFVEALWGIPGIYTILFISLCGGAIIISGGLKTKIKLDAVVVILFLFSSVVLLMFCFHETGGITNFINIAGDRLNIIQPSTHQSIPWTSVFLGGLWVLHVKYWAFFQPIAQTALASASLSESQKGFLFAASVKVLIPFLLIIPGIIGYELYASEITVPQFTLTTLISKVAPASLAGIIILGYVGTMFATYTGYLNATSVILSLDIGSSVFKNQSEKQILRRTRITSLLIIGISICLAVIFSSTGNLFDLTLNILLSVTPVSTTVFLFAIFSKKTPAFAANISIIAGIPVFFLVRHFVNLSLLDVSGLTFLILSAFMLLNRIVFALPSDVVLPEKFAVKFERNLLVEIWGIFLVASVFTIYAIFL